MVEPTFTESQPPDEPTSKHFKKRFQGTYLSLPDSTILRISGDKIIEKSFSEIKFNKNEIDTSSNLYIRKDYLVNKDSNDSLKIIFHNDTIIGTNEDSDTLFEINNQNVLKYFKKVHFLNFMIAPDNWNVMTLQLDKYDSLRFNLIIGKEDIYLMEEYTDVEKITNEKGDTIQYRVTPTKKEFKRLLKSDLFKSGLKYKKISKEVN